MVKPSEPKSPLSRDAWLNTLRGAESVVVTQPTETGAYAAGLEGIDETTEFPGGTWRTSMLLPVDLNLLDQRIDPLLALAGLAATADKIEYKTWEVVSFCRSRGKTWTEIGRALGVSKQAAWERFSGED